MEWQIDITQTQNDETDYEWVNIPLNKDIDGEWTFTASKVKVNDKGVFMFSESEEQALGLHFATKFDSKSNGMRFVEAFAKATNNSNINGEAIEGVGEGLTLKVDLVDTKKGNAYKRFTVILGGGE